MFVFLYELVSSYLKPTHTALSMPGNFCVLHVCEDPQGSPSIL